MTNIEKHNEQYWKKTMKTMNNIEKPMKNNEKH